MSSKCADLKLSDKHTVVYDEKALEKLVGAGKSADCLVHYQGRRKCEYALIELKGSKISIALKQLENTVKALRNSGQRVNEVLIICSGISSMEQRRYVIDKGLLYVKEGRKRKKCRILGAYEVLVIIRGKGL